MTSRAGALAEGKRCNDRAYADRQEKLIELNKKRLTPQKQLQALLANLKDTPKNIYEESLPTYLASIQ